MNDEKYTYYVSVQSSSIVRHSGDMSHEFVVVATKQEIEELQRLFDHKEHEDDNAFFRAHVPFKPYHEDAATDAYDQYMLQIYRKIHELGTLETKTCIADMGILHEGFALQNSGKELDLDQF
jgi:hypothetical protein